MLMIHNWLYPETEWTNLRPPKSEMGMWKQLAEYFGVDIESQDEFMVGE